MPSSTVGPEPRLLINVVDDLAKNSPDTPWLMFANSSSWEEEGGYRTITWKQLANAINKTAFWLDEKLPPDAAVLQTVAYLGPKDPRYHILIAAATKSKRRLFIPDGRLTPEGTAKILKEVDCIAWICTEELPSEFPGLQTLVLPSIDDLLDDFEPIPSYPYFETWKQSKDKVCSIIHTSGTTGDPKPIYLRNGFTSVVDSWNTIFARHPNKVTYRHMVNRKSLNLCAPAWLGGQIPSFSMPAFLGGVAVMPPPDMVSPPDPQFIVKILKHTGATGIFTPPSVLLDFHADKEAWEYLKGLDFVCWLGAALDKQVGDDLAPHTTMFPIIGSTERGGQLSFESEDISMWDTYDFIPEMAPRFEPVAENLYQLCHYRTPESELFQGGFFTTPELDVLHAEELYEPVLDSFGNKRWRFRARKDDLVKLSWLAKFHASHIESAIEKHPDVKSVFVGGEGRDVPYIIIEPNDHLTIGDKEAFIDGLYNTVIYDVNARDNDEIRIPREMIMLTDPALPFKRTAKMTIMRKGVEQQYQEQVEALYQRWEAKKSNGHVVNGHKVEVNGHA